MESPATTEKLGKLLARHGRRDAACRTYTYYRETGSIAFPCKNAQPRTPAIAVLLIGKESIREAP
jgi:hypothetical protein